MSKYQQFFIFTLLLTLLTGCKILPLYSPDPKSTREIETEANSQHLCEEQRAHLQQDKEVLTAELVLAKEQIKKLEAERNQLKDKLDALTAIERSFHERKQRQSKDL